MGCAGTRSGCTVAAFLRPRLHSLLRPAAQQSATLRASTTPAQRETAPKHAKSALPCRRSRQKLAPSAPRPCPAPNPALELTRYGRRLWPLHFLGYSPFRGQSRPPTRSAQLYVRQRRQTESAAETAVNKQPQSAAQPRCTQPRSDSVHPEGRALPHAWTSGA
jgi:hypothetical protein